MNFNPTRFIIKYNHEKSNRNNEKIMKNTGKVQRKYRENTGKMIKIHLGKLLSL